MQLNNNNKPDTAVIMVGGFGTRLSEETVIIPKPLVE
jgi:NDP-sugar pyrophosphorylase family protein